MPIDTQPLDLVFDQLLKPFKGRKKLSRGYGGLTFPCENGKSEGVGGSYLKFPLW